MKSWLLAIVIFFLLWLYRFQNALPRGLLEGQKIRIAASLREEPQFYGQSQRFTLAGIKIKTPRFPEYHWGDRLVVTGEVKVVQRNRFYREYWLEWPETQLAFPNSLITLISPISPITPKILSFKSRFVSTFRQSLPEPHASLLAGIVLGEKLALPTAFWRALKKTGTLHIVVASGSNITFLAGFLMGILPLLFSRKLAYAVTSALIWFYVVLAGAEAPIFRAGVMGTIAYFGMSLGKTKEAVKGLLVAAIVLLLIRPLSFFDLGFQLSFAATLGIILFSSLDWKVIKKLPKGLGEALRTTISAQIFTAPIIILAFGTFPLLSPLVNILVYWTIPPIMGLGALAGLLGLIRESLGRTFCLLSYPLLEYFIRVVEFF